MCEHVFCPRVRTAAPSPRAVILDHGEPVYARITDNWPTREPWFNETGDNGALLMERARGERAELRCACCALRMV